MINIDKTDFVYKSLQSLGVENIDDQYMKLINNGVSDSKSLENYLLSELGLDFLGDIDESALEDVLPYFSDLKQLKKVPQSKINQMLKEYIKTNDAQIKEDIINAKLNDVLLLACAYKMRHLDINLNDLVQTCNIGVITALAKYNQTSKIKFDTYINYWILDAINKEFTIGE